MPDLEPNPLGLVGLGARPIRHAVAVRSVPRVPQGQGPPSWHALKDNSLFPQSLILGLQDVVQLGDRPLGLRLFAEAPWFLGLNQISVFIVGSICCTVDFTRGVLQDRALLVAVQVIRAKGDDIEIVTSFGRADAARQGSARSGVQGAAVVPSRLPSLR